MVRANLEMEPLDRACRWIGHPRFFNDLQGENSIKLSKKGLMTKATPIVYRVAFVGTGLVYGIGHLGRLGQLALPSGSAIASYSVKAVEGADWLFPITSTVLGGAAFAMHFNEKLLCPKKCQGYLIAGIFGLSIGLASLLPSDMGRWVRSISHIFRAIAGPTNAYLYHRDKFISPGELLISIAELTTAGLFSSLPGSQWIEPIAGLGGFALLAPGVIKKGS